MNFSLALHTSQLKCREISWNFQGLSTGGPARLAEASSDGSALDDSPMLGLPVADSIAGRKTAIDVPRPGSLTTSILPPAALTTRCTVARPRPVPAPGFLVVKKGSNSRARVSASMPQPLSSTVSETARRVFPDPTSWGDFPAVNSA